MLELLMEADEAKAECADLRAQQRKLENERAEEQSVAAALRLRVQQLELERTASLSEKQELNRRLTTVQDENERRVNDLTGKVAEVEQSNALLRTEVTALKKQLDEGERRQGSLQLESTSVRDEQAKRIQQLEADLSSAVAQKNIAEAQSTAATGHIEQLEASNATVTALMHELKEQHEQTVQSLQGQVTKMTAALDAERTKVRESEQASIENGRLAKTVEQLSEQLDLMKQQSSQSLDQTNVQVALVSAQLKQEREAHQATLAQLRSLDSVKSDAEALRTKLQATEEAVERQVGQLKTAMLEQRNSYESRLAELGRQKSEVQQSSVVSLQRAKEEADGQIKKLTQELAEERGAGQRLKEELERGSKAGNAELVQLQATVKQLGEIVEQSKRERAALVEEHRKQKSELQEQLEARNSASKQVEIEMQSAQAQLTQMVNEVQRLRKQLTTAEDENDRIRADHAKTRHTIRFQASPVDSSLSAAVPSPTTMAPAGAPPPPPPPPPPPAALPGVTASTGGGESTAALLDAIQRNDLKLRPVAEREAPQKKDAGMLGALYRALMARRENSKEGRGSGDEEESWLSDDETAAN